MCVAWWPGPDVVSFMCGTRLATLNTLNRSSSVLLLATTLEVIPSDHHDSQKTIIKTRPTGRDSRHVIKKKGEITHNSPKKGFKFRLARFDTACLTTRLQPS
jgi:hypothetical protein